MFDGASLVFDAHGAARRARQAVRRGPARRRPRRRRHAASRRSRAGRIEPRRSTPVHEVYEALVLGTRDYVRKNGFTDVLISLSGGIDSSLVAAIAVDALGAEHVTGVMLPSRYSSEGSVADAEALAERPRHPHVHRADRARARRVRGDARAGVRRAPTPDVAEENLQARIRGNVRDDHLEQVRLDGAQLRQQERDGDRLRHALRRHGRRLRGDQGRAEDARVRAVPRSQRARRAAT